MIAALGEHGVEARADRGADRRLDRRRRRPGDPAARSRRGVEPATQDRLDRRSTSTAAITTHGFAINVNNDLQPFEWIVPCGIEACRMTSLAPRARRRAGPRGVRARRSRDRFGERLRARAGRGRPARLAERSTASRRWSATRRRYGRRDGPRRAERIHVTRSRAPTRAARDDRRGPPVPRAQAAVAEGAGAGRARPTAGSSRRSRRTTSTPSARRRTAPTSASAGSAAPRPS